MDRDRSKDSPAAGETSTERRRARLAEELRANLKRRKAQARARRAEERPSAGSDPEGRDREGH